MSQPLEAYKNAWRIPELKQRIIFTLVMLAIYRLGAHVPTPGIDGNALSKMLQDMQGGLLGFYDMFTGGAFNNATVFALGIMPYISASIIIQLLVSVVPALEKLQKEGAEGQKKITEYTRYLTIGLCIIQSVGVAVWLKNANSAENPILVTTGIWFYFTCIVTFTTGTAFIMWQGEQISEHGVGNGMSLIIFTSIVAQMPNALWTMLQLFRAGDLDIFKIGLLVALMVAVIAGVILVTTGQRRVPVQYPRQVKGRKMTAGGRNYLPLRVNQAGVIPIIFAASIMMLPGMVGGALKSPTVDPIFNFFSVYFGYGSLGYSVIYGAMIIFFCFFYTAITFNPIEMADNMKKYGGVVLGVRPGKATAEYLNRVMTRITLVGSIFLAGVALIPHVVQSMMNLNSWQIAHFFGGTSLLILVGVALDTVRQIETHLTMRNYDGFMKGRRMKGRRF